MACTWVCIVKQRMSCLYVWKLKLQVLFQKRNWNFAFEHLWHDFELLNLLFKIASHNSWETTLKCFVTMPLWQFNNLGIILCHQSFLLHCLSLTCWKHISFLESIYFFSYGFENLEQLITSVNLNAAPRESLIVFIALMVSPSTNWRAWPWQCQIDPISFMHVATPVLAPSLLDAPSGPNLDLYASNNRVLPSDAKHLEKGLNRGWWNFWFSFFQNKINAHFGQYWKLPKFSR